MHDTSSSLPGPRLQVDPPQSRIMCSLLETAGKCSENKCTAPLLIVRIQARDRKAQKDYTKKREQEVDSRIANKGQKKGTRK